MELRGLLEFTVGRVEKDELMINSSVTEHLGSVSSTRGNKTEKAEKDVKGSCPSGLSPVWT